MKEELEKLIKENFYDDHENCDDSCGKKADYTELITSIINLVDKEVVEVIDGNRIDKKATRKHMEEHNATDIEISYMEIEAYLALEERGLM